MSRHSEGSPGSVFFLYAIIFCFASWGIWSYYQTLNGPTTLATVVGKDRKWHKNSYDYYLNIQFVHDELKVATSRLEIAGIHYPDFEPGDTFPIKYAKNSPEDTAFVGEQFYTTWGGIGYSILVLILVVSFRGMRRKDRRLRGRRLARKRPTESQPELMQPARYSAVKTLTWAAAGAIVFGCGIVSCRHAANFITVPVEAAAHQYAQATLLSVHYSAATNHTSALVRLPDSATTTAPVRVALSPEQHALLHARLARPQPRNLQLLVAYLPTTPNQAVLADGELPPLDQATEQETPVGISYSTLGILLSILGLALVASNLIKYTRHAE